MLTYPGALPGTGPPTRQDRIQWLDSRTLPRLNDLLDALLAHDTKLEDAWLSAEEEAAWKRTPWERVVPILIADHGLRGVEPGRGYRREAWRTMAVLAAAIRRTVEEVVTDWTILQS